MNFLTRQFREFDAENVVSSWCKDQYSGIRQNSNFTILFYYSRVRCKFYWFFLTGTSVTYFCFRFASGSNRTLREFLKLNSSNYLILSSFYRPLGSLNYRITRAPNFLANSSHTYNPLRLCYALELKNKTVLVFSAFVYIRQTRKRKKDLPVLATFSLDAITTFSYSETPCNSKLIIYSLYDR